MKDPLGSTVIEDAFGQGKAGLWTEVANSLAKLPSIDVQLCSITLGIVRKYEGHGRIKTARDVEVDCRPEHSHTSPIERGRIRRLPL